MKRRNTFIELLNLLFGHQQTLVYPSLNVVVLLFSIISSCQLFVLKVKIVSKSQQLISCLIQVPVFLGLWCVELSYNTFDNEVQNVRKAPRLVSRAWEIIKKVGEFLNHRVII